jgi:hypothetical protein
MTRINGPSQRRRGFIYVRCVSTVIDIKIDVPLMYVNVFCMEMCKGGDFYRRPVSAGWGIIEHWMCAAVRGNSCVLPRNYLPVMLFDSEGHVLDSLVVQAEGVGPRVFVRD